ncbi:hypothetical protein ACFQJC_08935 [Haloferax namakaokahaiae]|uniref:DUF7965 domain-containing protein n=1 Tax=Haloferax namakaokahaiae TaxID=1748331 RepID=A0ABD5ZEI5_9EURY
MAETNEFEAWVVSSFNLTLLSLVLLLAGHTAGFLAGSLSGFGTLPGVLAFGYLWLLVFGATRWALQGGGLARIRDGERRSLLLRGIVAGGAIGAVFLLGLLLVILVVNVLEGGVQPLSFALFALFGGSIASIVGGLVGGLSVVLDIVLYEAAGRLLGAREEAERTENETPN